MNATAIGLAEAKDNLSRVTAEVNRTGKPVTVLRNNRPWVTISPAAGITEPDMVAVAVDFMGEYADVFDELSKRAAYPSRRKSRRSRFTAPQ